MPIDERKLVREIKEAGCSIKQTSRGHFLVLDPEGNPLENYAVKHPGKREVLDFYVSRIRKALTKIRKEN